MMYETKNDISQKPPVGTEHADEPASAVDLQMQMKQAHWVPNETLLRNQAT